ncbi:hypothetical protein J6TS7_36320 [Paenibacillus dendritiformis]|nr:hypothetical protein J6TS7_36320 [Paenibacillus dendritiformis]
MNARKQLLEAFIGQAKFEKLQYVRFVVDEQYFDAFQLSHMDPPACKPLAHADIAATSIEDEAEAALKKI